MKKVFFLLLLTLLFTRNVHSQNNTIDDAKEVINTIKEVRDSDIGKIASGLYHRSLILGLDIGQKTITIKNGSVEVYDSNGNKTTKSVEGKLASDFTYSPYIAFSIPGDKIYEFSPETYLGYLVLTETTVYNLNKQSISIPSRDKNGNIEYDDNGNMRTIEKLVDLGTTATGRSFSVVPTIYYVCPISYLQKPSDDPLPGDIGAGLGIGLGYLEVSGESYITTNPANSCEYSAINDDTEGIKNNCGKKSFFIWHKSPWSVVLHGD